MYLDPPNLGDNEAPIGRDNWFQSTFQQVIGQILEVGTEAPNRIIADL